MSGNPRTNSERETRRRGGILGLAAGDSLGATHEFRRPEDVPEGPLEIVGGGTLGWNPGDPTDDTELAITVLEGYGNTSSLDLGRVREAMLRWYATDPRDIGNQTRVALRHLEDHPEARQFPEDSQAQGNGAVMRAGAHGVMAGSPEQAATNAWEEAGLTHPSWAARASAALVASLVATLVSGAEPREALETSYSTVQGLSGEGRVREVLAPYDDYEYSPGGWTVHTTRLASLALLDAPGFREGVERVVRRAGDADTNGAVAGTLLGARFGVDEIPANWLETLREKERLLALIRQPG